MELKKIISLVSFAVLLLCLTFLISACGTTTKVNKASQPTVNTNEDINSAINNLIEQQTETSTSSTVSEVVSFSATSSGEVKANINLDDEIKDLDNTIKGADSKGFSDSDLNVN